MEQRKVKPNIGDGRTDSETGSEWSALDWAGLVDGYARYWRLPFVAGFGGVALRSDGRLPVRILRLRERQGREAIARL